MRRTLLFTVCLMSACLLAQDLSPVPLPAPQTQGGRPLMQALKERKSLRAFSPEPLPAQVLSNLLWAAFGINRTDGHRTAPSAMNWQEMSVYVATKDGLFLYDAQSNQLTTILQDDIRKLTGTQDFVAAAPVNLVYVADFAKVRSGGDSEMYVAADAGFIAQNVYLFCASEGLATVVRGSVDRTSLSAAMKLRPQQKIILAQTVGYSKK